MDHREHARLAAVISRRRKQLARLKQEAETVREQLARDEHKLQSLLGAARDVGNTEIIANGCLYQQLGRAPGTPALHRTSQVPPLPATY